MNTTAIEHEALHLPAAERAKLAHKLLLSLEDMPEAEMGEVWLDEAEHRAKEIDEGQVPLTPAEEVGRKARALLLK